MKKISALVVAVAFGASSAGANAATFFTEASYNAANTTANTVTFEGLAPDGQYTSVANPLNIGNLSIISIANSVADSGFFLTPNDAFFVNAYSSPASFAFDASVTAFGVRLANGFNGGTITASIFNGANLLDSYNFNVADEAVFSGFFGVNGLGSITSFTLTPASNGFLLVDQVQSGAGDATAAVPEPSTWAMMLVGFGAIGFAMRRKRQAVRFNFA